MRILSWNIQFGRSCNGNIDLDKILDHIDSLGEFDFICLQELSRHMDEYSAVEQRDQVAHIEQHYPGYNAIWGSGFSWPTRNNNPSHRQEFGNLTLAKQNLLDHKIHLLPLPSSPGNKQMQRIAVETVVDSNIGSCSIINTHLAFHDDNEKQLQLNRLYQLEQERIAHIQTPKQIDTGIYQEGYLAQARILCGDFNMTPDTSHYQYQIDHHWIDAWEKCFAGTPRSPTCGIYDWHQWPEGEHCRDYFWLSNELTSCKLNVIVDTETRLSDHQPIILEISV